MIRDHLVEEYEFLFQVVYKETLLTNRQGKKAAYINPQYKKVLEMTSDRGSSCLRAGESSFTKS